MKTVKKLLSLIIVLSIFLSSGILFSALPEADASSGTWLTAWTTSMVNGSIKLGDTLAFNDFIPAKSTIRTELTVTTAGTKLRLKFSNEYSITDITLDEVSVAKTLGSGEAKIVDGTQTAVTFNGGETSVTVKRGETVWSDEIDFETAALEKISVSVFFRNMTYITTGGLAHAETYLDTSNLLNFLTGQSFVNSPSLNSPSEINISSGGMTYHVTPFLCAIDSLSHEKNAATAVFIGDSTLVNNTHLYFAEKLVKNGITNISVVNEAIIANKVLSGGSGLIGNLYGDSLLSRFERDALNLSGVKYIFIKEGLNDIIHQYSKSMSPNTLKCSTDDIIAGYIQLINAAHERGIKVYFFTKSAWKGYERAFLGQTGDLVWSKEAQDKCDELDKWIKTNKLADGYIDVSPLANPSDTYALCPSFTPDGAHLTDLASIAVADLIPLKYVGVKSDVKLTSAEINSVDPYKEKNQIISQMNSKPETTTKAPENTTQKPENTTAAPENTTAAPENTTTAVPENTTAVVPPYITESTTAVTDTPVIIVPETEATVPYEESTTLPPANQNTSFNPSGSQSQNTNTIGNGGPIVIMLILFFVVIIAGAVVLVTVSRRKEEEKETQW